MKLTSGLLVLTLLGTLLLSSCASSRKGTHNGRKQPSKGSLPCPVKDC